MKPLTFVLASKNKKKLTEMQTILGEMGIRVLSQAQAGVDLEPEETGTTFEENAVIKARAVSEASGLPAIADDSGLMVDALDGAPGVYSARYGGEACKTDRERYELLLKNMALVPDGQRTARFVCVIAAVWPDGRRLCAHGACEGVILRKPGRDNGFGYDPVFCVPSEGCTFSEMPPERKNEISHRANALRAFQKMMTEG